MGNYVLILAFVSVFLAPTAAAFCEGGNLSGSITLHPDRESLAEAMYADYDGQLVKVGNRTVSIREALPAKELKGMDGFISQDGRSVHVMAPRSATDRERIYAVGHEVLHLLCGGWHDGRAVGWSDRR